MRQLIYHRLVQRDLQTALDYYDDEGGCKLGDRFFADVEAAIEAVDKNPQGHHFSEGGLRRVSLRSFPYHFLYDVDDEIIWPQYCGMIVATLTTGCGEKNRVVNCCW